MGKIEELQAICARYGVGLVYLFGSQKDIALRILEGEKIEVRDPLADIDLGVVFCQDIEKIPKRFRLYARMYNEIEDLFLPHRLDLVFLEECHSLFQLEALKGICLFQVSEKFRNDYEMMVLRRAADFRYVLEKYLEEALHSFEGHA